MQREWKTMLFPCQCNCLWKIALLVIALLDVTSSSRLTLREWPPWCSKLCHWDFVRQWIQCDPLRILFHNVEKKLRIADVTAIVMALRSLIKTESRTAKLRQVDSPCRGLTGKSTCEWMNQSLLLCSLPVCPFLILSFQVVCFWEKSFSTTSHVVFPFHVASQVSRYLDGSFQLSLSPETDIWKKSSNRILIFCISSWNMFEYLFQ